MACGGYETSGFVYKEGYSGLFPVYHVPVGCGAPYLRFFDPKVHELEDGEVYQWVTLRAEEAEDMNDYGYFVRNVNDTGPVVPEDKTEEATPVEGEHIMAVKEQVKA